jgi:hypothetical protein
MAYNSIWDVVADAFDDSIVPPPRPSELANPVTLAAHCDPSYKVRGHVRVIADEMKALSDGEFDRLLLNMPPQVGKSRTAVEWGAFWWLAHHPTHRVVIGAYGHVLAIKRGKAIRKLVEQHGKRYGLEIERGSASMSDWALTSGGGVLAVGVGSGVTGQNADIIFIDDPTKSRKDAESVLARDNVHSWYSADLLSRQAPGCPIVLIQTPWHPDDLRGRVVREEGDRANGGRWRVVIMAAICEVGPEADPLGREVGQPLPHPKIAEGDTARLLKHWEDLRAAVAWRDWRALWQCDPKAPEGALVSAEMLRERRCFEVGRTPCDPVRSRVGVAVDPSGGGRDTAGIVGGYLSGDLRMHIVDDRSGVMPSEAWGREACKMAAEIGADFFVVEKNYGGDMAELVLRTSWEALRREDPQGFGMLCPRIIVVTARQNKQLRAEPIGQQWVEAKIVTTKYLPDLESEWATWTVGSDSPGRIDASVYLAYELLPLPSSGDASNAGLVDFAETDLLAGMWGRR